VFDPFLLLIEQKLVEDIIEEMLEVVKMLVVIESIVQKPETSEEQGMAFTLSNIRNVALQALKDEVLDGGEVFF
jgi:hypothetical protein